MKGLIDLFKINRIRKKLFFGIFFSCLSLHSIYGQNNKQQITYKSSFTSSNLAPVIERRIKFTEENKIKWVLVRIIPMNLDSINQYKYVQIFKTDGYANNFEETFHEESSSNINSKPLIIDSSSPPISIPSGVERWSHAANVFSDDWLGSQVPKFSVFDLNGEVYDSKKLKRKITILYFWFKDSKSIEYDIHRLNILTQRYSSKKDVVFLSFALNSSQSLETFLIEHPISFPVIPNSYVLAQKSFGIGPLPSYMVVDWEGKICHVERGYSPQAIDRLAAIIDQQLFLKAQSQNLNQ